MSVTSKSKVVSFEEAAEMVPDGATIGCCGVIGWITPDRMLQSIAQRYQQDSSPSNCTFYFPCGTGDSIEIPGMDHVAVPGLMKRIISGSYINPLNPKTGERPKLMQMIHANKVEAYSWPIGATTQWLRETTRKGPGLLTEIGIGCYIDPRQTGGKVNDAAKDDLVFLREMNGKEYLFYPTFPIDIAIVRGTTADIYGNVTFEKEPFLSAVLQLAMAAKSSGGKVIVQVERVVERGSLPAHMVRIPGCLVDAIVVDPKQVMGSECEYLPEASGEARGSLENLPRIPFGVDKVIARRAAREVRPGEVGIFGFGAAGDVPLILAEDGNLDDGAIHQYHFTTEHGPHGGVLLRDWQFSANYNLEAIVDCASHFDFIDGGGCPFTALAFAEFDQEGSVNVSKFGKYAPGAGGFIDIAHNAKRIVFTGTFTGGGPKMNIGEGRCSVEREGKFKKLVKKAQQITYPTWKGVKERGQSAMLITERAVFLLEPEGLVLTEIAPGIDLQRDVLDQMEFAPARILDPLPLMDAALFTE
jgi:propionate CoA-transferase